MTGNGDTKMPAETKPPDLPYAAQIQQLLARAEQGDTTVLPELQAVLDKHPEIWRACGDLAQYAEHVLLKQAAETNLLLEHSVRRYLVDLKSRLAGPDPSPLEKLLVDRVALDWATVHLAEARAAGTAPAIGPFNLKSEPWEKRVDGAHRRLLHSCKVLATVRRLLGLATPPFPILGRIGPEPASEADLGCPEKLLQRQSG
jgi:hypothetical protein